MRNGKVCFGIVGCGTIGPVHAKAMAACESASLIATCDIDKERAEKLAAQYGPEDQPLPSYADARAMLDDEKDLDCVCVCTYSGNHYEIAVPAAEAGKHVLCEKPLDITHEHMDAIIDTCDKMRVKLGGIFQRRAMPNAIKVRQMLADELIGKLVLCDNQQKYYRAPSYYASADWRGTWELDGGGALMNQGIHGLDLTLHLMGDVTSVFAYADAIVRDIEVEDTAVVTAKFANGALGSMIGTTAATPPERCTHSFYGENGSILLDDTGIQQVAVAEEVAGIAKPLDKSEFADATGEEEGKKAGLDPKSVGSVGHAILIEDMAKAILEDRAPMIDGREARRAVDLILAIYESMRTGQEVVLRS